MKLKPRDLKIPKEVIQVRKQKRFEKWLKNPVFKFFYVFFGEGF